MGATQPHPGRGCGGTLGLVTPTAVKILGWSALWHVEGWECVVGLGQMPEYIGDFILVEDPVWQLCENLQAV